MPPPSRRAVDLPARTVAVVAGLLLLGVGVDMPPVGSPVLGMILTGGAGVVAGAFLADRRPVPARHLARVLAAVAAVVFLAGLVVMNHFVEPVPVAGWVLWGTAIAALGVVAVRPRTRAPAVAAAVALGVLIVVAVGAGIVANSEQVADVYELHVSAAEVVAAGGNPYVDARATETFPWGSGEPIVGYTYPPAALIPFVAGGLLAGDPRWTSVVAVAAGLLLLALLPLRAPAPVRRVGLAAAAAYLALPSWVGMIFITWTEAVTFPLLLAAAWWWRRRPVAAGILLGLGLATKQYFVLALPLLLVVPDARARRRSLVAVGAAAAVTLPWLLADPRAFVQGTIVHHLTRAPRPDALTLPALGVPVPGWLAAVAAVAVAVALARRVRHGGDLLLALAAVVATFTLFAVRGFVNNWWMVTTLALGAVVVTAAQRRATPPPVPTGSVAEGTTSPPPPGAQPVASR